ncbi:GNAT family N-acetyltransferase [Mycolicibacterium neoaurum]|uniref:GNAT family N-acetyltransferase n=1 Tax=Mycolicibacterium neoaurum TaxID=1795 RepID=UPI00248AA68D|nr:GNAT family N-acetyltransferase [Mycolicibacterium neoaurum]MDO3402391.1 GNAT family N-acetyltransferase [Mycolicibacterium neoaurum]WBP95388.1 GNAT family N-acetyltransferase [Mycolicibacterium neoaurum]WBS09070.1 GNAT family N-acetyltransferase [Mycolicibacterium neoaurum]
MGMGQVRVARLTETDWRAFAGMRLRALTDSLGDRSPHYRHESTFTAAQWRRRLRAHAQFALVIDNRAVGLIGAQRQGPESVYLYSLWLDPTARGRGLGRTLVSGAVDWARSQRVHRVNLRVHRDNAPALAVYDSLGFTMVSGDADAGDDAPEVTMTLTVN